MQTDRYSIREDLTGWKTRIINGKCHSCKKPINTKDGYFKLVLDENGSNWTKINIHLCPQCLEHVKCIFNQEKPEIQNEYETKYKEAMVRGIEKGNR
jgi:hypothetical protein